MYAIIEIGTNQYKVSEGDRIDACRLGEKEGKSITVDKVLLYAKGNDVRIGQPYLKDVKVTVKVIGHDQGKKVVTQKYRRRKNSACKNAHRQKHTVLDITKIAA